MGYRNLRTRIVRDLLVALGLLTAAVVATMPAGAEEPLRQDARLACLLALPRPCGISALIPLPMQA